jgi:tRNA threonylcarbamoyladenosine biosynthesis protein TsaB
VPDQPIGPLVLAIDTTHEFGSLALARGGDIIEEVRMHEPGGFAHVLYAHIDALLRQNNVPLNAIDCFAAASGPGSFTGVRIGLACIKGLAEALAKPAAGISNLQALASYGSAPLRAPVIDARRGEIYGAVYDNSLNLVQPEIVAKLEVWQAGLPTSDIEIIWGDANRPLAGAIARLAAERLFRGDPMDPAALDANYIRRSDAELFWKE